MEIMDGYMESMDVVSKQQGIGTYNKKFLAPARKFVIFTYIQLINRFYSQFTFSIFYLHAIKTI